MTNDITPSEIIADNEVLESSDAVTELNKLDIYEIVRGEQNIAKWADWLFPHGRAKDLDKKRTKSWKIKISEEDSVEAAISITPLTGETSFTVTTYDVYMALTCIFYEKGMPDDPIETSLRKICKTMGLSTGGKNLTSISEELHRMSTVSINWLLSFKTCKTIHETIGSDETNFQILDTFRIQSLSQKTNNKQVAFSSSVTVRFCGKLRENLKSKAVIPINWAQQKKFKSDLAKVLFGRVDNIMASGSGHWSRTATNLLSDLLLSSDEYKYKSKRKPILVRLQKALNGCILSTGSQLIVVLEETALKDDWKLNFSTDKRVNFLSDKQKSHLPIVNIDANELDYLISEIGEAVGNLDENKALYRKFALHYSSNLIHRALSEWKEDMAFKNDIKNPLRFFTAKMHQIAHKMGKEWIKDCGKQCKYRVENDIFAQN